MSRHPIQYSTPFIHLVFLSFCYSFCLSSFFSSFGLPLLVVAPVEFAVVVGAFAVVGVVVVGACAVVGFVVVVVVALAVIGVVVLVAVVAEFAVPHLAVSHL